MKKVKLIAVILATVLVLGAIIGGTFAYLTDTEGVVNVMTVGNVDISLHEYQRNADASALVDFEQGKMLIPVVGSAQGTKDRWGMPEQAANFMDKIVTVENVGKNDAYVRVMIAVPQALVDLAGDGGDNTSDDAVHISLGNRVDVTGQGRYSAADHDWSTTWGWDYKQHYDMGSPIGNYMGRYISNNIEIDGELYYVETYTLPTKLAKGETTNPVFAGVYLDSKVDYDNETGMWTMDGKTINYDLTEGVKIPVFAQAVQADGFADAANAFKASFGLITEQTNPWTNTVMVSTEDELIDAVATAGNSIQLLADIELTKGDLAILANTRIYGNGFAIKGNYNVKVSGAVDSVVIKNVKVETAITADTAFDGVLSVLDCTFDGTEAASIIVDTSNGAKVKLEGNTFAPATTNP